MALFWFLLMIGPLVFFHELGHFVAARRFGVKCESFAIGMGPPIASFRRGETEFSIRLLPLGGYVSMLGAMPDEEVDSEDAGRALTDKPIWQRMIVYLAGPVMNVVIAVPFFWLFFMGQAFEEGPEVGMVLDGTPAAEAGLKPGDRITAINGRRVRYFDQIRRVASRAPGEVIEISVDRGGEALTVAATPEPVTVVDPLLGLRTVTRGQLGIVWSRYPSFVHVDEGSVAWEAGLRHFDQVTSVNGQPVEAWLDLAAALDMASTPTTLEVRRLTRTADTFASLATVSTARVVLPATPLEALGVHSAQAAVFDVLQGSPADVAGLRSGDRILRADGLPVTSLAILLQTLAAEPDVAHELVVSRGGSESSLALTPLTMNVIGELRSERDEVFVGVVAVPARMVPHALVRVGLFERAFRSVGQAFARTGEYVLGIFLGVFFLIIGVVDSSNLGGPLMIADVANRAGSAGLLTFVRFMAVISINLGIVNLLPVPGLDGGHLMLLTAEGIKREPLSFRARQIASYVGVVCLVLLMLFAFKNDVERYWADFATWLNS